MHKIIRHRLNIWQEEPSYWQAMEAIDKTMDVSSLPKNLRELIRVRVSQINKCIICIDLHTEDALKLGESARRLFALSAWQESPLFTDAEKSVLQLAEEITHISAYGVLDSTYESLKAHFSTREIADLIVCICHINFLNRVGVATKTAAL